MLGHELERVLHKILSGKTLLRNLNLEVLAPSVDLLYEAEEIYCEYYNKNGTLTREELKDKLVINKIISSEDVNYLEGFSKVLENLQKELYLHFSDLNADPIRSLIKQARKKQESILFKLSQYESYSKEGMAGYAKSIFLINNTTYREGKKFDFKDKSNINVLSEFNKHGISNDLIRLVARKSSWTNTWYGLKDGNIFKSIPTLEQQLLIMWSKVYDNIRESPEAPDDNIISDDDALDGWLLVQREESAAKKRENALNNTNKNKMNSKIANSDEVFFIARSKEDVERINKMNDAQAERIKQQRINQIYDKGAVDHHNLLDVRMDIQAQYHKLAMEHIKNGNKN